MDKDKLERILFAMLKTLNEIRSLLAEEKAVRERAERETAMVKEMLAMVAGNMPQEVKTMIEPILRMEK